MTRAKVILAGVAIAFVGLCGGAVAAAQHNFRTGPDVTVGPNQTIDSTFFAWGSTVDIAGTVNGDVFCAGQNISITGTVNGDVFCAGQSVSIVGTIDGSVRVVGQTVTFSGQASRSLSALGQAVSVQTAGHVARDVSLAGQQMTYNGSAGRDLYAAGQQITLDGTVGRDVEAAGNAITLGSSAVVAGSVIYTSSNLLSRATGAHIGGVLTHYLPPAGHTSGMHFGSVIGGSVVFAIFMFISLLALSLVLALLLPQAFHAMTEPAMQKPWRVLLVGFGAGIAAPIILFFLTLTIIGLPLALLGLLTWVLALALCGPLAGYYLGRLLLGKQATNALTTMLVGTAVLLLLDMLPLIGFLVSLLALLFGFGMIAMQLPKLPKPQYKFIPARKAS